MTSSVQDQLADFDAVLAEGPQYGSSAIWGAVIGAAAGFWTIKRREPRKMLKYAACGAVINMGLSYVLVALGKKGSAYAHEHPEVLVQPPPSPVVTKGAFAGAPRALYRARHQFESQQGQDQGQDQDQQDPNQQHHHHHHPHHGHHGHHVGAPTPPGGDYSFTRRPGYNGKDY